MCVRFMLGALTNGPVAHLVERSIRIAEARGSIPLRSTKWDSIPFFVYKNVDNFGYKYYNKCIFVYTSVYKFYIFILFELFI